MSGRSRKGFKLTGSNLAPLRRCERNFKLGHHLKVEKLFCLSGVWRKPAPMSYFCL